MALGVRFHKTPSEIMAMSIDDYALLMAHFQRESEETTRAAALAEAKERAARNLQAVRRR